MIVGQGAYVIVVCPRVLPMPHASADSAYRESANAEIDALTHDDICLSHLYFNLYFAFTVFLSKTLFVKPRKGCWRHRRIFWGEQHP